MSENLWKVRVVIDTNIFLVSISSRSKYHLILQSIFEGNIELCVSNSILMEYEEILSKRWNSQVAQNIISALLKSPFVKLIDPRFNWEIISQDPDDNKFVDCAVAGNAQFLATNDKHFDVLTNIEFPVLKVLDIEEFLILLSQL